MSEVSPGDCFDKLSNDHVTVRPCTDAHDGEVIEVFLYPAKALASAPCIGGACDGAIPRCSTAFAAYVGRGDAESVYEFAVLTVRYAVERRDLCAAFSGDGQKITGSVKGVDR